MYNKYTHDAFVSRFGL